MDWIDIRKELPKEDGNYLVCASSLAKDKSFIQMAWYDPNGFGWSNIEAIWIPSITHWMPVELPKDEKTVIAGEDLKPNDLVWIDAKGYAWKVRERFALPDDLREAIKEAIYWIDKRHLCWHKLNEYLGKS
jgi:hypothetical protein